MPKALSTVEATAREIFPKLGLSRKNPNPGAFWGEWGGRGPVLKKRTPIDDTLLASVYEASPADYERVVSAAQTAFKPGENCLHRNGNARVRSGNAAGFETNSTLVSLRQKSAEGKAKAGDDRHLRLCTGLSGNYIS